MSEAFALFVRILFQIAPPIPEAEQEAANARGKQHFEIYRNRLREALSHTSEHLFGMMDDVYADESALEKCVSLSRYLGKPCEASFMASSATPRSGMSRLDDLDLTLRVSVGRMRRCGRS